MTTIAILTNARAADQRSMIGYGELVLEAARATGARVVEWRGASAFARLPLGGRWRKLALNLDRFIITPLMLAGRRADIVHVVDPGNCVYLPLTRHRRSIITVHDLIPYLAAAGRLEGFRPTLTGRWLMRAILHRLARADRIVSVSQATRADLLALTAAAPDRVVVIPNAVFQPMAPASADACQSLRHRLGLPPGAPFVLHVGRNFYKNRGAVLEAVAQLRARRPEVHLVLVGALEPPLAARAETLGLGPALHVIDHVARDDMAALYTAARVLLFPSLYEGFGYPVLEAQMCGTPVVCSNGGALAEVAGEGASIVAPTDIAAMAAAAEAALDDGAARSAGVDRGRKNAAKFTQTAWFAAHARLYGESLEHA